MTHPDEIPRPTVRSIATDALRVLTFQKPSAAISVYWRRYLAFGMFFTWLAGVGRYWDSPRADVLQYAGLGSVYYVLFLALILWLIVLPLRPKRWSYRNVLVFVTLTSPPALLYAIPVELFMPLEAAMSVNAVFLAVIAAWRVALLVWFLRTVAELSRFTTFVASMLPLTVIVCALTVFNLQHAIFNLMAGNRPGEVTQNDFAHMVVAMMAMYSLLASPILLCVYLTMILMPWQTSPPQVGSAHEESRRVDT